MVIDDERTVLQALNLLLEMWGYRVVTAESEGEAIDRLSVAGETPHAILADYRLREGRTGVQAIDRIRAEARVAAFARSTPIPQERSVTVVVLPGP